jgi:ABC-2 type transport system permease protein
VSEPAAAPTGTIHDLGYKRYLGGRRSQATRWRVIVRNQVSTAWKTWWRYKMALAVSVIATLLIAGFIYVAYSFEGPIEKFSSRFGIQGNVLDTIIWFGVPWLCRAGFLAGLTVGAGTIAADAQVGAFTFYFARPVRTADYVLGKLGGLFLLQLILIAAPLVALAGLRIGLSSDSDDLLKALPRLGAAIATGVLGALVFSAVPLGASSLASRRRNAIAIWAVWYIVIGYICIGLGFATRTPALGAVDPLTAIDSIAYHLFGAQLLPGMTQTVAPLGWAIASVLVTSAAAIAIAFWQVARRGHAGVGSG